MTNKNTYKRLILPVRGEEFTITYTIDGRLSICGRSGQNREDLLKKPLVKPFTKNMVEKLFYIWNRYHLNDMKPGTPKQMELLRKYTGCDYSEACRVLKENNLYIDNGYRYGSSWLFEKVPDDIIRWLFELPGVGNSYTDIFILDREQLLNILGRI